MRKDQRGFTAIHLIIVLLALGLVGLVGWYVWHVHEHDKKQAAKPPTVAKIASFADCVKQQGVVQTSYPEVCVSKNGQHFTNPDQKAPAPLTYDACVKGGGYLGPVFPPDCIASDGTVVHNPDAGATSDKINKAISANPPVLIDKYLSIPELGVKIRLSDKTSDATYSYDDANQSAWLWNTSAECKNNVVLEKITDFSGGGDDWRHDQKTLAEQGVKTGNAYYILEGSQTACGSTYDTSLAFAYAVTGFSLAAKTVTAL